MKPRLVAIPLFCLSLAAAAQQAPPIEPSEKPAAGDPFAADNAVSSLLGSGARDPLAFQPLNTRPALPDMRLRGIVQLARNQQPAALVELSGYGSYTVRAGETISFTVQGRSVTAPVAANGPPTLATAPITDTEALRRLRMTGAERERAKERGLDPRRAPGTQAPAGSAAQVTTGTTTGVVVREPVPIVLRVERVAKDGVVVEIGTMGQYLIIR